MIFRFIGCMLCLCSMAASVGGVPTLFTGIELNPARPWYTRFVPTAGWWLVLLFVPAVGAAFCSFFAKKESKKFQ